LEKPPLLTVVRYRRVSDHTRVDVINLRGLFPGFS
jgi:hypothetical protein